ncbi:hypothetical protein ACU4GD_15025 [Cupriavidus basilensis]
MVAMVLVLPAPGQATATQCLRNSTTSRWAGFSSSSMGSALVGTLKDFDVILDASPVDTVVVADHETAVAAVMRDDNPFAERS